jgi:23S rRNA pseudouridine1911/1915/1917 synthase
LKEDKAYKLLAIQEGISNSKAKELIDAGLVFVGDKKLVVARGLISVMSRFKVVEQERIKILFEDENLIAVVKPHSVTSEIVAKKFKDANLLHRLDKETSGVLILCKDEEFREKAIEEFRQHRVYKEYVAVIEGRLVEEIVIDSPIETKKGKVAKSIISKDGKEAKTTASPVAMIGKKTKVKVIITTGRTHQIRVHLSSVGYPILGDLLYGSQMRSKRVMLHSKKIELLGYKFEAKEPREFEQF